MHGCYLILSIWFNDRLHPKYLHKELGFYLSNLIIFIKWYPNLSSNLREQRHLQFYIQLLPMCLRLEWPALFKYYNNYISQWPFKTDSPTKVHSHVKTNRSNRSGSDLFAKFAIYSATHLHKSNQVLQTNKEGIVKIRNDRGSVIS